MGVTVWGRGGGGDRAGGEVAVDGEIEVESRQGVAQCLPVLFVESKP